MKVIARLQVTLDVPLEDWILGAHAPVATLHQDAIAGGLKKLQQLVDRAGGGVRIVGQPHVTLLLEAGL